MTNKKRIKIIAYVLICISIVIAIPCNIPHISKSAKEDMNPRASALDTRTAYAIVVGVEDYPGSDYDLNYCVDDANSINSRLYNNYGFDDLYIHFLLDSAATKDAIWDAFNMIGSFINSGDVLFFYFSGHGGKGSFTNYICPYDSITDSSKRIYDTDLDNYLDQVNCSEQYIIIDSCGSGGMIDEAKSPNRYFMTASSKLEDSWETSALGHGVFTYYFLRSFTLASDSNGDGVRSMEEQYDYTYTRTVSYTTNMGDVQHPQEYDGVSGETVINTAIGSLIFTPNGTQLDYSFYLYGHGSISVLRLTVCCVTSSTIETFDLTSEAPSSTGFGFYSGNVTVSGTDNITSYKIRVVVYWPNIPPGSPKIIEFTFGDSDGDTLTDIFEIDNGLNPLSNDTDSDGLDDYYEFYGITDPLLDDTDGDGMLDGYEVFNGLDPLTDDSLLDLDGDGLINILEYTLGTSANNPDTDGDSMDDGYEYEYGLDLLADDAGLDLDGDGLTNLLECQLGSYANNNDSDSDTMPDKWEYDNDLDLLSDDTGLDLDGDGLTNLLECQLGSYANNPDTDGDSMDDGYEYEYGLDLLADDAGLDLDGDGLTNLLECQLGSYANNNDSDSDTMPDKWEYDNNLNLIVADAYEDPDGDGLSNVEEYYANTDPHLEDTDGDTWSDGDEILEGTDPLDPDDYPRPPAAISAYLLIPLFTLISIGILIYFKKRQLKKG